MELFREKSNGTWLYTTKVMPLREEIRQTFNQLMPADNPLRQESSRLAREISLTMKNITTLQ